MRALPIVTGEIRDLNRLKQVIVHIHGYCIHKKWIKPHNLSAMSSFEDARKVLSDLTHELVKAVIPVTSLQAAVDYDTMSTFIGSLLRNIRTQ